MPIIMLAVFETVAITLWLTKNNLFYLFNFSYIGLSISLGVFLYIKKYKYARRIVQLLVGLYMLVYLGLICNENMQIEGFWYYLFTGVFEAATNTLCRSQNIRTADIWTRMVRICLLDSYGAGFSALQSAKGAAKKNRMDQVYNLCGFADLCSSIVPCSCGEPRENHVLGIYHW